VSAALLGRGGRLGLSRCCPRRRPALFALSDIGAGFAFSRSRSRAGGDSPAGDSDRLRNLRRLLDTVSQRNRTGFELRRVAGAVGSRVVARTAPGTASRRKRRPHSTSGAARGRCAGTSAD
jgi:hypothetical protein